MKKRVQPIYSDKSQDIKKHRNILIFIAITILMISLLTGVILRKIQSAGRPNEIQYPILGVMLDQSDGYQDFVALQNHKVKFVYIKATQGANFSDDFLESNTSRIKGTQLQYGFFHVVSFDTTAKEQFENITKTLVMQRGTLPFVLKVSSYGKYEQEGIPKKKAIKIVDTLKTDIKNYYGDNCIIQLDDSSKKLSSYFSRIWYVSESKPQRDNWLIWQYNNSTSIPGYAGEKSYRLSVLNGNVDSLNSLVQTNE
ncbi:GH25 family lysozyme [Companilactobacillus sp. DQM5]|uniref:GH25 family lysozyme n=1 Tax=Companilactobacillus sp. DQM5 TaxID=3463359 RepID=UPI004057F807